MVAYPKGLISIVVLLVGLALFFIFASFRLVSQPIGSTVRGYFNGVDDGSANYKTVNRDSLISGGNETLIDSQIEVNGIAGGSKDEGNGDLIESQSNPVPNVTEVVHNVEHPLPDLKNESSGSIDSGIILTFYICMYVYSDFYNLVSIVVWCYIFFCLLI